MKARILSLLILIGGIIAIINLSSSTYSLFKKGDLFVEKEEELAKVEKKNQELKSELKRVQGADFIEKEAREKLSMGKRGEIVIILPKTQEHEDIKTQEQKEVQNWRKWYNLFFY